MLRLHSVPLTAIAQALGRGRVCSHFRKKTRDVIADKIYFFVRKVSSTTWTFCLAAVPEAQLSITLPTELERPPNFSDCVKFIMWYNRSSRKGRLIPFIITALALIIIANALAGFLHENVLDLLVYTWNNPRKWKLPCLHVIAISVISAQIVSATQGIDHNDTVIFNYLNVATIQEKRSYSIFVTWFPTEIISDTYLLLYLWDSMRTAIGQFSVPYSTVRPAKSKTLFFACTILRILRHNKYLTNLVSRSVL